MSQTDDLQLLVALLESCERELSGHRNLVVSLRETVYLLRYESPERFAAKMQALHGDITDLRASVAALTRSDSRPRERLKTAQQVVETLTAMARTLAS